METLVYPKLSVLVRETEVVTPNWDWRATFLLVQQPSLNNRLRPVAIVRVLESHPTSWCMKEKSIDDHIRRICPEINADYFLYEVCGGSLNRVDYLNYYNSNKCAETSNSFNFVQYMCTVSFCPDIQTHKGEELFVCHEPSLDSFLDLQEGEDVIRKVNSELVDASTDKVPKSFFSNSSVDALVCLGMPNGIPLFGIEFDGSTHENPYQQVKDKAKNELFKRNGLPLLRVKSSVFNTWVGDIKELFYINYGIGRSLIEGILSDGSFIKLIVHYLKSEGVRAGETTNTGSNILALANRVDEFFDRQKRSILTLSEKASGWDDQMGEYLNNDPEYTRYQKIKEEAEFGIAIHSVKHKWSPKGLIVTIEFAPNMNERKIMNRTAFSFGPYNVTDATGSYEFSGLLSSYMEGIVRSKAEISLNEGKPSVRDKLLELALRTEIENMTHNQRVNYYICDKYLPHVISWVQSSSSEFSARQAPSSPVNGINNSLLMNLQASERLNLFNDLNRIHDLLVTHNIARFLFEKGDLLLFEKVGSGIISFSIRKAIGDKSILDYIENIDAWRSMIKAVREKWVRFAERSSEPNK